MKIAIIVRKLNVRGGVQRQALSLARAYQEAGDDVALYAFVYDKGRCYGDLLDGLRVTALGYYPAHRNFLFNIFAERRAARRLAALIDPDTDVLNPHDQVCYKVAHYFQKSRPGVPAVWTMHDMPTRMFGYRRARELDRGFRRGVAVRLLYWLADQYEIRRFIRRMERIAVLDSRDQELVKKHFGRDAVIVRNGLDTARFPYRQRAALGGIRARLLMNGIFFRHRRFEDGIRALKILADRGIDVILSVVGNYDADPAYYRELADLCAALGVAGRVKFLGEIPEDALAASYREHDIFIFPNHLQSWGLAVFEAMACGTPVIVSESAGASEVLTHGENALVVSPMSPERIADAAGRLMDDGALYEDLSRAGRAFVEREISWARTARTMRMLFSEAVKRRKK